MTNSDKTWTLLVVLTLGLVATAAVAHDDEDEDEHHGRERGRAGRAAALRADPTWKTYEAECGACHLAFPPHLLPASSWTTLLGGLGDHFGEDASLDAATRATLEAWLSKHAGGAQARAPLRLTETSWWRREHDEVAPAVWARKAIGTKANCAACHPRANAGAFGEHEVRIPRDAPAPR